MAQSENRLTLRRDPGLPLPILDEKLRSTEREDEGRILACAGCLSAVTTTTDRIRVGESHHHHFVNPHGIRFHIGCFARAPGCRPVGPSSTFWTWFPGHSWQIEQCGSCGEHLGWRFASPDSVFHGLILARLVEAKSD